MDSDLIRITLLGGLLPGLVVGVGLLLLWGLLDTADGAQSETSRRRLRLGAPVLFCLGFLSIAGATGPVSGALWPSNVTDRVLVIGGLALLCGLLDAVVPWRIAAVSVRFLGGGGSAWVVASALYPHAFDGVDLAVWIGLSGVICALGAWLMAAAPDRRSWLAPAQGVMVVMGLLGLVYWSGLAGSSTQVGGVVAMLVAATVASALLVRIRLSRGGWTSIAVLLTSYVALGRALGDLSIPPIALGLVLGGVGSAAIGRWLLTRFRLGVAGVAVALTLTAAPVGGGAWIAWRAYDSLDDETDDFEEDDGVYYTDEDETSGG